MLVSYVRKSIFTVISSRLIYQCVCSHFIVRTPNKWEIGEGCGTHWSEGKYTWCDGGET